MISGQLSAEISATCSSLGHNDGITYNIDPYCKESIKDLIRYLRRDSEDHAVRRFLGSTKVLKTDLVPILIHHSDNDELFDVVLRLVMNLTTPALIVYQEQIPSDKTERNLYLQLISQLQDGKQAFTDPDVWNVLAKNIGKLLETESYERDEDTSRTMERILILARNVLAVPSDADYERRPDNDVTVHDKVLWAMHKARMDEIFLYIASSDKEQQVYMHILEIVSLMLREQNPSTLAKSEVQRSFSEKEKDEEELLAFRQAEIKSKQMKLKKYAGTRHFGGTYVMMGVKAAGDKDLIFHKPLDKAVNMEFNFGKKKIKWPKNLQPLKQVSEERKSTFGVRLFLKEFCVDLLNGAYNPLMRRVKDIIERGKSNGDESYYFWAMKFFMEFNRNYNFQVKLVSETLSIETFHFIQTQLENWNDLMMTDQKKIPLWSRRMHLALKAYQELLLTLSEMDRSPDANCRSSSQILKSRVFYVTEYRDLLAILIHVFKKNRFSQMYMKDLIETLHIFMKMLQKFSERHRGGLVVQQKKRVVKRTAKKNSKSKSGSQQAANMEAIWDQVGPQLSAVLQTDAQIPTVIPFDATSDVGIDEQKVEAMKRIQSLLKNGCFEEAIGLLRAAREVWPENNCFGAPDLQPEDEFMAVRDIFMADLGQPGGVNLPGENANNEDDEDEENEEEYGDEPSVGYQESELNFEDFVRRFISEKTLQICGILLNRFEDNSVHTNHCVVKLLHRIAVDCHMPAMLFQASLFRIFQRAMSLPNPEHKELRRFGRFMVQKFLETAEKNSKVFIEMLFWKKVKDAIEITEGYGSTSAKSHSVKNLWTEEQEDELSRLCNEFMSTNPPGSNPVDWIMENLINRDRSRVSVVKKLKELHLWSRESVAEMKRSAREWSQDEEDQLRELVPAFLNAENPMECIMSRLIGNRSKNNVIRKILDLGLAEDRKQLRNKRSRKSREKGRGESDESDSSSDGSSDDEAAAVGKGSSRPDVTFEKVVETLNSAVSADLKEPLEWLVSSMSDMLEDLESGDQEDVPILPLTESCTSAMENDTFIAAIETLGIKRPDEQEVYWRIPGNWNEAIIKETMKFINDAIEGNLSTASDPGRFNAGKVQQKESKEKTQKKKKNNRPEKKKTFVNILDSLDRSGNELNSDMEDSRISANNHSDSGNDSSVSRRFSQKSSQLKSGRKVRRNSDSSSESSLMSKPSDTRKRRGLRLMLESDSDSDYNKSDSNKERNGVIASHRGKSDSDGGERKSSQLPSQVGSYNSSRASDSEHASESSSRSNSKRKHTRKRAESRRLKLESDSDSDHSRVSKTKGTSLQSSKIWRDSDSESSVNNGQSTVTGSRSKKNSGNSQSDVNLENKVSDNDSISDNDGPKSSQRSSHFGSQKKGRRNRDSSSESSVKSVRNSTANDKDSNNDSPKSSQMSSYFGSQKKGRRNRDSSSESSVKSMKNGTTNDNDSNNDSPKSSQRSSHFGSQKKGRRNRDSSSESSVKSVRNGTTNDKDSNNDSPKSSQRSSHFGSQKKGRRNRDSSSESSVKSMKNGTTNDNDSNNGSPKSSQRSSHFGSQKKERRSRDSSSESWSGKNGTRKKTKSYSSMGEGSQSSVLNNSQLKRKRNFNSSSDNSDNQENVSQHKKTTKSRKVVLASSSSSGEEDKKDETDVMTVDDELTSVSKSLPFESDVDSANNRPKRKRIILESNSDSDV